MDHFPHINGQFFHGIMDHFSGHKWTIFRWNNGPFFRLSRLAGWLANWRGQALGLSRLAGWLANWRGQALGLSRLAGWPANWRGQALGLSLEAASERRTDGNDRSRQRSPIRQPYIGPPRAPGNRPDRWNYVGILEHCSVYAHR